MAPRAAAGRPLAAIVLLAIAAFASPLRAADPEPAKPEPTQPEPAKPDAPKPEPPKAEAPKPEAPKDITWTLSGEARFRPEWRDNADLNSANDDENLQGFMRLRLGTTILVKKDYRVFFQIQDSRVAGEEAAVTTNEKNLDLHQGFVELLRVGADGMSMTIGRQEWKYGDERLIGAQNWANIGRSFDGVKARYSHRSWWLDGFVARVTSRFTGADTTGADFLGLYGQYARRPGAEYEGYALMFNDH